MFRFALLGAAAAFSDETSLMQGLKPVQDVKKTHDKHAVANLLESAKSMLKNGETADVVTFAQATLDEIVSTVIPAIQDAHDVEQALLEGRFAQFECAISGPHPVHCPAAPPGLAAGVSEIRQLDLERHSKVGVNIDCRNEEARICEEKQYCDYGLYYLWRGFIMVESDLRETEDDIYNRNDGHFCAEDAHGNYIKNGTTEEFRRDSVPIMHDFARKWPLVITAEGAYDAHRPTCQTKFEELDDKTAQCHSDQASLEGTACQHRIRIKQVVDDFNCAWERAMVEYDFVERNARLMQIDRIREFQALSTVECLLNRTTERNGRPCDEHTDEITVEISHCEEVRRNVDTSRFELEFPCEERECGGIDSPSGIGPHLHTDGSTLPGCDGPLMCPEVLPQCAYMLNGVLKLEHSNYQGGRCRPLLPEHPCTAGEIFPGLPDVPQPDFHAQTDLGEIFQPDQCPDCLPDVTQDQWKTTGNSHCNQREPCQLCELPETAECPVPERVWSWYTTLSVRLPAPAVHVAWSCTQGAQNNHNQLGSFTGYTYDLCAQECAENPACLSFDSSARDGGNECYLSSTTAATGGGLRATDANYQYCERPTDEVCTCEVTDSVGHLPSTNLGTQGALVVTNTMNEWVNTRGGISSLIVTKLTGSGHCALTVATGALGAGASSHIYGEGEHHYPMPTGNDNIHSFNLQCHAYGED